MFNELTSLNGSKNMYSMIDTDAQLRTEASKLFEKRLNSGRGLLKLLHLAKQSQALLSLADTNGSYRQQRYLGVQTVRLDQIIGSENRTSEFDRDFRPRAEHLELRWANVAMAYFKDIVLPPVDLIQVGDVYYVRDGHHRISVARTFGQESISAIVTVWE